MVDQQAIADAHAPSGFCSTCANVKRQFDGVCRDQGTTQAMNDLRGENLQEWIGVIATFRDQRRGRGQTNACKCQLCGSR